MCVVTAFNFEALIDRILRLAMLVTAQGVARLRTLDVTGTHRSAY